MEKSLKIKILGMDSDSDVSKLGGMTASYNLNLRFMGKDNETAIQSEKGTTERDDIKIIGNPIGAYSMLDYLIIFSLDTTYNYILIYHCDSNNQYTLYYSYKGNFNFDEKFPIDCLGSYEREDIIKIYWIDGKNVFRFLKLPIYNEEDFQANGLIDKIVESTYFNTIQPIESPTIKITKQSLGGIFPSGTIQYAFTYFNKYGNESNIVNITPLYYLSGDGGEDPDKTVDCSFKINITIPQNNNWEYIRIYSIIRTALDSSVNCKKVEDISIKGATEIYYVDTGAYGEQQEATKLLYLGGEAIIPNTFAQKDNTLFLGNYSIKREELSKSLQDKLKSAVQTTNTTFFVDSVVKEENQITYKDYKKVIPIYENLNCFYENYYYKPQLNKNQDEITTFKGNETYRIGIQLQDNTGRWSEPIFIFDAKNTVYPKMIATFTEDIIPTAESSASKKAAVATITPAFPVLPDDGYIKPPIGGDTIIPDDSRDDEPENPENSETGGGSSSGGDSGDTGDTEEDTQLNTCIVAVLPFGNLKIDLSSIYNDLLELGYKKIRPVIVFPKDSEREVLFQGVVSPSLQVKNEGDNNLDYYIPSWYFRAIPGSSILDTKNITYFSTEAFPISLDKYTGILPEYRQNYRIPSYTYDRNPRAIDGVSIYSDYSLDKNVTAEFQYPTNRKFVIDWNVFTINSPELLFNDQLSLADISSIKLRLLGYIGLRGNSASYSIEIDGVTEVPESLVNDSTGKATWILGNNFKTPFNVLSGNMNDNCGGILINYPLWIDGFSDRPFPAEDNSHYDDFVAQWYIYPWHRSGSLNNCSSTDMVNLEGAARPSMLKRKIFANLRFGYNTIYLDSLIKDSTINSSTNDKIKIYDAKVFLQESDKQFYRFQDGTSFRNRPDMVLTPSSKEKCTPSYRAIIGIFSDENAEYDYVVGELKTYKEVEGGNLSSDWMFDHNDVKYSNMILGNTVETDSTNIAYEGLLNTKEKLLYTDCFNDIYANRARDINWDWEDFGNNDPKHNSTDPIPLQFKSGTSCVLYTTGFSNYLRTIEQGNSLDYSYVPLVEVYRDVDTKFGGTSETALMQNNWLPAGDAVDIINGEVEILYSKGDTYFQRYDCLKTYPFSETSKNNIVEILSFMCETHINIDGRYDVNRGLDDNTVITDLNFNKLNTSYSQKDNYFEYYKVDEDLAQTNDYKAQITWTLSKNNSDLVDNWTKSTLTNILTLDANNGSLNSLNILNDQLYAFQDKGLSLIKFNQNAMVNATNGVPIEIANSDKVTGSMYITSTIGCLDKFSIVPTPSGLVFNDAYNGNINVFNGENIVNIGDKAKFRQTIRNTYNSTQKWDTIWSKDPNSLRLFYDNSVNEVLFVTKNSALAYNIDLNLFTSYYNYEETPFIIKNKKDIFALHKNEKSEWKAWNLRTNNNREIFGKHISYKTIFNATASNMFDFFKMYTYLELRDTVDASTEDTYESNHNAFDLQPSYFFDTIKTKTSYQESEMTKLEFKRGRTSSIKPKFRSWRVNIPRNKNSKSGRIKDRMCDRYLNIELTKDIAPNKDLLLHDMELYYIV